MNSKNVIIIEPLCKNVFHSNFNAAYINKYFNGKRIKFLSPESHWDVVKEKINNKNYYEWVEINSVGMSFLAVIKWIFRHLFLIDKDTPIVFLSCNIFVMYIAIFLKVIRKSDVKCIFHADLEQVNNKKTLKDKVLFFRRHYFLLKIMDVLKIETYVLSRCIAENLKKVINLKFLVEIEHPYLYGKFKRKDSFYNKSDVKIGFIGVPSKDKGFDWLQEEISKNKNISVSYTLIGPHRGYDVKEDLFEMPFKDNELISDQLMLDKIMEMDFIIFPFNENQYRLRASGTFFDAMNAGVPVISTKNDYMLEMLFKDGQKGFVFNRELGLSVVLNKIKEITEYEYLNYLNNIRFFLEERK